MKKFFLIFALLIISHSIFFILVDRNRQSIKSVLVKTGLWNSNIYTFIQQKLTNKELKIEEKQNKFLKNLPENFSTNHFNEKHEIFDLENINGLYDKNINYGYITFFEKKNNFFYIITNNGYFLKLNNDFSLSNIIFLKDEIKYFYTDYAYGGIRGAKWIDQDVIAIYLTVKEAGIINLSLISVKIESNNKIKLIDKLKISELPNQDGTTSNLGGGIEFRNDFIYLTTGTSGKPNEYEISELAQDENSNLGKILKISVNEENKFVNMMQIAKGSRNSQGLQFVEDNLIAVEHGPQGGDEINVIETNNKKLINLGWPNFSYGLPYHDDVSYSKSDLKNTSKKELEKYYNDSINNYQSPVFYFTPSIAISHITTCPFLKTEFGQYKNCFIISSLKDKSFYVIKYSNNIKFKVESVERIYVGSRIRKIYSELNTIFLCLDNLKIIKIKYDVFK